MKVSIPKPIDGVHRIPGLASANGTSKLFAVDTTGATKFRVLVSLDRRRVMEIAPLVEGSPRAAP